MSLLTISRLFMSLISLLILGAAGYLLWSWVEGEVFRAASGELVRVREDWRLWVGLFALAWSVVGRFAATLLLAKKDDNPTHAHRGDGEFVASGTGSSLFTETVGPANAPTVIFTHGWGMDSTFWFYAKRNLGERFRVLVWDLPGLGRSKPGPEAISLKGFAADLATLIARCDRQPVYLVGHSIGGMTIQTLLRDNPDVQERVAGVVLLNTTYTNPLETMVLSPLWRAIQRPILQPIAHLTIWLSPLIWLSKWQSYLSGSTHIAMRVGCGKFVTRSQLEHVSLLSTRASPAVEARGDLAMFCWDAGDAMKKLTVPALVIGGDMDLVTNLEASRVIANESPLATLRVVEGVNHMGPMERADLYNRLIIGVVEAGQATRKAAEAGAV